MTELLVPFILLAVSFFALTKKENTYSVLTEGAQEGLKLLGTVIPALVILLTAISMLRASGALEQLAKLAEPITTAVGIPPEVLPLILVRPISGSAALGVFADLLIQYGADSPVGRTAAVMMGSTETTFYTICVYFGAANIKKTRYALPAALCADLTGFLTAALTVRLLR